MDFKTYQALLTLIDTGTNKIIYSIDKIILVDIYSPKAIRDLMKSVKIRQLSGNSTLICLILSILGNLVHKKKSPVVEQVFLIHQDGRLISYTSIKGNEYPDEDIVSGMLTALTTLLIDAFVLKEEAKKDIGLYTLEFGDRNVVLKMGNHLFIALVMLGKHDKELLDKSEAILRDIEEKYKDVIVDWDGTMRHFLGVDEMIMPLLPLEELSEEERETVIKDNLQKKVFELWSKIHLPQIQDNLIPRAHTWKNLNWKLDSSRFTKGKKEAQENLSPNDKSDID
jgi:hypothetical protein